MYKLPKQQRDEIVAYLKSITVPAHVGAGVMAIVGMLSRLEEIKEEKKEDGK